MRAPEHSRKPFVSLFLLVEIIALTLFVVGPQAGSLDDDGDGNPDVPVVVSSSRGVEDFARAPRCNERLVRTAGAMTTPRVDTDNLEGFRRFPSNGFQHRMSLPSLWLLRC